jgi:hypothetical protein
MELMSSYTLLEEFVMGNGLQVKILMVVNEMYLVNKGDNNVLTLWIL